MKKTVLLSLLVVLGLILGACGNNGNSTADGTAEGEAGSAGNAITVKLGHASAPGSARDLGAKKFKEVLENETNGAYKVAIFPSGQLGGPREQIEAVQLGNQEMTIMPSSFMGGFQPLISLFDIPFLMPAQKEHLLALHDSEAMKKVLFKTEEVGIKTLGIWHTGYKQFTGPKALTSPADFKGLKFRAMPSPVIVKQFTILGGIPTDIDFAETYNALQTGTIDGQENPMDTIFDMKFHEVQDYVTLTDHGVLDQMIMVNKSFYDSLDDATKESFYSAFVAAKEITLNETYKKINQINEELKASGEVVFVQLSEEQRKILIEAVQPVKDFYKEEFGEEGTELLEAVEAEIQKITQN